MPPGGALSHKLDMSLDELSEGDGGYGRAPWRATRPRPSSAPTPYADRGNRGGGGGGGGAGCRLFVGNLAYSTSWQELKDHMRAAGEVLHCKIMADPGTPCGSKGCGLVEFATAADAQRALRELAGRELRGRPLFLREDRGDPDGGRGRGRSESPLQRRAARRTAEERPPPRRRSFDGAARGGASGRGGDFGGSCSVFVGNLAYSVEWPELKDHMRQAGDVLHVDIFEQPGTAWGSRGCALVRYAHPRDAQRAIHELSETELRGRCIFVREDREDGGSGGGRRDRSRSPIPAYRPRAGGRYDREDPDAPWAGGGRHREARRGGGGGGGCRVFVGNLPYEATWKELKDHMRQAGDVVHCDVLGSKGCGIVEFARPSGAARAIRELSETSLMGRDIFIREDREE